MSERRKTILWYMGRWIGWPFLIVDWAVDQFFEGVISWKEDKEKKDE